MWTRVISLQALEAAPTRVWDLGPDIITELENMQEMDEAELPILEPPFDPIAFQQANKNIHLQAYKLAEDELRIHGTVVTKIR